MKTVVCLALTDESMFNWLGTRPAAAWTMEKLAQVRGIDRSVCFTPPALAEKAAAVMPYTDGAELVVLPEEVAPKLSEVDLAGWLCTHGPAASAEYLALVKPSYPFLPYQRIEECLELVRSGGYDVAATTRHCSVFDPAAFTRLASPSTLFVEAVVVVKARLIRGKAAQWPRKKAQVEVSFVEGTCVDGEPYVGGGDPLVVAQAMADNGVC